MTGGSTRYFPANNVDAVKKTVGKTQKNLQFSKRKSERLVENRVLFLTGHYVTEKVAYGIMFTGDAKSVTRIISSEKTPKNNSKFYLTISQLTSPLTTTRITQDMLDN
jgi:hypothetical protein